MIDEDFYEYVKIKAYEKGSQDTLEICLENHMDSKKLIQNVSKNLQIVRKKGVKLNENNN